MFIFASAPTRARVVSIRLVRNSSFRPFVQRPPATDAPARFTTASAPTPAPPNSSVAGFHATSNPSALPRISANGAWPAIALSAEILGKAEGFDVAWNPATEEL